MQPGTHPGELVPERGEQRRSGSFGHRRIDVPTCRQVSRRPVPAAECLAKASRVNAVIHGQTRMPKPMTHLLAHGNPLVRRHRGVDGREQLLFVHDRQ